MQIHRTLIGLLCLVIAGSLAAQAEMRVSMGDALKNAVKKNNPEYSPLAKQMKIQGDVEVELRITEAGDVGEVKVVSGNAMLTQPVVRAVKDWKFAPFTEGGKPVGAVTLLRFSFKL